MSEMRKRPATAEPNTALRQRDLGGENAVELLAGMRQRGEAVADVGRALALAPQQLVAAEALDRLEIETSLPLEAVEPVVCPKLAGWFDALGDDLRLDLRLVGLDTADDLNVPQATVRHGNSPVAVLDRFLSSARAAAEAQGNELAVELRVAVGKAGAKEALRKLLASRPEFPSTPDMLEHTLLVAFYHSAAWLRLVTFSAYADWERLGLARAGRRTVLVLCDADGYLAGPALEIIGARLDAEPRWLVLSRAAWRQFCDRSEETRRLHTEESRWSAVPGELTPAHLRVERRVPGLEAVANAVAAMRAALAAAYLASSVHERADGVTALRFSGVRPCTCDVAPRGDVFPLESLPEALPRLATWAYANASADKLNIAREALARELPAGGTVPLTDVERAAGAALDAAKANFTLYLRRNTERYFQLRAQALDAVSSYAEGVRKAVSELTSDVVDNVYRTVGLLVGVVIAALIQPPAAQSVQRLASLVYVAYVLFVLLYLMRARWHRFGLEAADLDARLAAMPELSESERGRLRGQASGANAYFRAYFRRSCGLYVALAAAGLLYFVALFVFPAPGSLPAHPATTVMPTPR